MTGQDLSKDRRRRARNYCVFAFLCKNCNKKNAQKHPKPWHKNLPWNHTISLCISNVKQMQLESISRCCKLFINFDLLAREAQNQNLTLISIVEFLKTEACDSYIYSQFTETTRKKLTPKHTRMRKRKTFIKFRSSN